MNYEQKYKNALEKLQEALAPTKDGCKISGLTRGCIENIFPELQESIDEKMKKAIIHILYENYTDAAVIEGVEIAEIVTWLEEQSKKKSADEVLKIRQELYQSGYNDGYKHGQEDTTISLEKESIEVDKRMRRGIIRNLQYLMDRSEGFVKEDLQERIAWLEKQGDTNKTINKDDFAQGVLKGAAINLITWIDYNAAEGNMCLSNMECKDIEDALVSGDWGKIYAYIKKKLEKQGEKDLCNGCTNDKGCVTCENGNLKEIKIEPKKLDADKVIEWMKTHGNLWPRVTIKINEVIEKFKKDFEL